MNHFRNAKRKKQKINIEQKKNPSRWLSMWFHRNRMIVSYLLTAPQFILIRFSESKMFNCTSVCRTPFVATFNCWFFFLSLWYRVGYLWSLTSTQRRHFFLFIYFLFAKQISLKINTLWSIRVKTYNKQQMKNFLAIGTIEILTQSSYTYSLILFHSRHVAYSFNHYMVIIHYYYYCAWVHEPWQ